MTLDEAIKAHKEGAQLTWNGKPTIYAEECQQMVEWLKELKAHREAWEKVELRLKELSIVSDLEYYVHREDNWFDGIKDAMSIVGKYRPKEGDEK